jgi:hypothetical protein
MSRQCIVCGAWFKYDRSAIKHLRVVHCVPGDLFRQYMVKADIAVQIDDEGDDVEVEFVS